MDENHLPPETEQALFRITQEALSNITRHSRARSAEIHMEYGLETLILSICDDGLGFNPANPGEGLGLKSMRERAERLPGGQLEVTSTPGSGTRVKITCTVSK